MLRLDKEIRRIHCADSRPMRQWAQAIRGASGWAVEGTAWGDRPLSRGKAMSYNRDWDAFNRDVIVEFRANRGKVGDRKHPLILLTTTGAKSGLPRTTPLNYTTDGDRIIVIASKAAAPTHPDWYHNLVAHPEATVELGAEQFPVRARVAQGQERERLFNAQAALMPFFAEYQQNTARQIPVIIFERIS